jgi:hypothetical protein
MSAPDRTETQDRIRVMVAAEGPSAKRLATILSSDYACVVAIADLGGDVAGIAHRLDIDILVMAGASAMPTARAVAEQVATTAPRTTVMIIDDPDSAAGVRVFWPKSDPAADTYRVAAAV